MTEITKADLEAVLVPRNLLLTADRWLMVSTDAVEVDLSLDAIIRLAIKGLDADAVSPPAVQGEALADIAKERARQISEEGWTPEHDDTHAASDLARAAACYALGTRQVTYVCGLPGARGSGEWDAPRQSAWPWDGKWWKAHQGRRKSLVKAGALIVAEIERLDRVRQSQPSGADSHGEEG